MLDYMKNYMDLFKDYFKGSLYKDIFNSTNDYCLAALYVFCWISRASNYDSIYVSQYKTKKNFKAN